MKKGQEGRILEHLERRPEEGDTSVHILEGKTKKWQLFSVVTKFSIFSIFSTKTFMNQCNMIFMSYDAHDVSVISVKKSDEPLIMQSSDIISPLTQCQ